MENYIIIEHIGEGSFGKVYKARRKNTGFTVAMKFISKHGKSEKDIRSLRQEIGILRKLNHENIILMFDAFETDREFCVITEYAQGELFDILQDDQRLPESTVQQVAKQLVKALHYLHSNRIIHRDMKPQNVLIGSNGRIKLCDFGFARAMSSNTIVLTSIKGTPLYMSPELVKEQPYDATSDLWSLGVILFELYVGQPPFYTNSIYSLINHIVKDPVKYPTDISKEFKSFLHGLLQKNPSKRLTWPHLLDHPFVHETEADREMLRREKLHYSACGGQGGPRERLESIMGADSQNMFGTMNIRHIPIVGIEQVNKLPHAQGVAERNKRNKEEHAGYIDKAYSIKKALLEKKNDKDKNIDNNVRSVNMTTPPTRAKSAPIIGSTVNSNMNSPSVRRGTSSMTGGGNGNGNGQSPASNDRVELTKTPESLTKEAWGNNAQEYSMKEASSHSSNNSNNYNSGSKPIAHKTQEQHNSDSKNCDNLYEHQRMTGHKSDMDVSIDSSSKSSNGSQVNMVRSITSLDSCTISSAEFEKYTEITEEVERSMLAAEVGDDDGLLVGVDASAINVKRPSSHIDNLTKPSTAFIGHDEIEYWSSLDASCSHNVISDTDLLLHTGKPSFGVKLERILNVYCSLDLESDTSADSESLRSLSSTTSTAVRVCYKASIVILTIVLQGGSMDGNSSSEMIKAALTLCGNMCRCIPQLIDICKRLVKRVKYTEVYDPDTSMADNNKQTSASSRCNNEMQDCLLFISVLVECVDLTSSLASIPSDEELHKMHQKLDMSDANPPTFHHNVDTAVSSNAVGVSLSDRWHLVALLVDIIKEGASFASDPSRRLCRRALKAIGSIISRASTPIFNMLLDQQVPSAICECLLPASGLDSLGNSSDIDNMTIRSGSMRQFSAFATHSLALLLHTVGHQWTTTTCMPLECVLNSKEGYNTIDFDLASERVMLRHKVCRIVAEKLVEGIGLRMNVLLHLLEMVCSQSYIVSESHDARELRERLTLRSAALRVLTHTTSMEGRYFCSSIASYSGGIIIATLLDMLGSKPASPTTESIDTFSQGLALATLRNLVRARFLSFQQLMATVKIVSAYVIETDDARVTSAGFALLSSIIAAAHHPTSSGSSSTDDTNVSDDMESITLSHEEGIELSDLVCKHVMSQAIMVIITKLLSLFNGKKAHTRSTSSVDPAKGTTHVTSADPTMWLLGSEFGHRQGGMFDGVLCLIASVASARPPFIMLIESLNSSAAASGVDRHQQHQVLSFTELVCMKLQNGGNGEISPIGVAAALRYLDKYILALHNNGNHNAIATGISSSSVGNTSSPTNTTSSSTAAAEGHSIDILSFYRTQGIVGLVSLTCLPQHLELCRMWAIVTQSQSGSNSDNDFHEEEVVPGYIVNNIIHASGNILRSLMVNISLAAGSKEALYLLDALYKKQIIKCLVESFKSFGTVLSATSIASVSHVLSELVLTSSKFITQFTDSDGLESIDELPLDIFSASDMSIDTPSPMSYTGNSHTGNSTNNTIGKLETVLCTLQIASHLARHSEKHYALLLNVFTPYKIASLLLQRNPIVKSKSCNLIGNLCRHSNRFYAVLASVVDIDVNSSNSSNVNTNRPTTATTTTTATSTRVKVLDLLIRCCNDSDSSTRKFACFAIGNAAFHSNDLYGGLKDSVPLLRDAMDDRDEKTRSNAAGAIGNLIRNGGELSQAMVDDKVPQKLLHTVLNDKAIAPQRIALFSLGTMSVFACCRDTILRCRDPSVNDIIKATRDGKQSDETLIKYINRLKQKLKNPPV